MAEESLGTSLVQWAIGGGLLSSILAWLGLMQRQVTAISRDVHKVSDKTRDDAHENLTELQKRVEANEHAIISIKETMVNKDDLERGICRIEKGVSELGRELRGEIKHTHERVDQLYRNGKSGR